MQQTEAPGEITFNFTRAISLGFVFLGVVECAGLTALGLAAIYAGLNGLALLVGVPAKHLWTVLIPVEYPAQTLIKSVALLITGVPFAAGCGHLTLQAVIAGWKLLRK